MKKIVFMGTPDFSVPILKKLIHSQYEVSLVVTQPDRLKGRKKIMTPPPIKVAAEKYQLPVFQPEKIKDDYQFILNYKPDLIVTAAYGQILPKEILDYPAYGCINVHASLLPELRGGAPIHYAIIEGKEETGITIMYMVEKLDAGDILTQQSVPISEADNVGTLHDKLSRIGADLLLDTLPKLEEGLITPVQQVEQEATFAQNIKRQQEQIDWSKSDLQIYNQIRGLNPWPVASTTYQGKNMKLWSTKRTTEKYTAAPGTIVAKNDDCFTVVCGNHRGIKITDIQPAGKKRMSVKDYLLGSNERIKIGVKMGE